MKLVKDEHIILSEYVLGFRKKLTLTNKRLVVQQGRGFLKVTWENKADIPLEELEEACAHVESGTSMSMMKLRLKNGNTKDIRFKLHDSEMIGASPSAGEAILAKVKSITDRWVNAINKQISSRKDEDDFDKAIKSAVECGRTVRGKMG